MTKTTEHSCTEACVHKSDKTPGDMLMSLNGFDELAIAAKFNERLSDLRTEGKAIDLGRALIFVDLRRQGHKDTPAWEEAMGLSIKDVQDYFKPSPVKKKSKRKGPADTSPADDTPDAEGKA